MLDVEAEAAWIYRLADVEADEPPGALVLAERLRLPVIRVDDRFLRGGDAALRPIDGELWICVRRRLPFERLHFAIAHEIAEWRLSKLDYRDEDREHAANALAAALLLPRAALRVSVLLDFAQIAEDFVVTQTCAALRVGEVTGRPLAVVSPQLVRVRGESFEWPEERTIRGLAKARALPPEVERVELTDDARRVVLLVG
jgi:IrrE N-terminal-like domain